MIEAVELASPLQLAERKHFLAIRQRIAARAVPDNGIDLKRRAWPVTPEPAPVVVLTSTTPQPTIEPIPAPEPLPVMPPPELVQLNLIPHIQKIVAEYFDVTVGELKDACREHRITFPRMIAMYLCKTSRHYSYPEVGRRFNRDHTTALSAVRKIARLQFTDSYVCQVLHELREQIQAVESFGLSFELNVYMIR